MSTIVSLIVSLELLALFVFTIFRRFALANWVEKVEPFVRATFVAAFPITAIVVIGKDIELSSWVYRSALAMLIVAAAIRKTQRRDRGMPARTPRPTTLARPRRTTNPAPHRATPAIPTPHQITNRGAVVQRKQIRSYVNQPLYVDLTAPNVLPQTVNVDPDANLP
ncbi:MAG: hypothetical protein AB1649_08415 [Chloroflexota bacterium]